MSLIETLLTTARSLPRETQAVAYFIQRLLGFADLLSDDDMQAVYEAAHARYPRNIDERAAYRIRKGTLGTLANKVLPPPRRVSELRPKQMPPKDKRKARRERRYALAHGSRGVLIPTDASRHLTPSEVAALTVVAIEIMEHGACTLYIGQIAAFGGCGERMVRRALRAGERLGLITVKERREGRFNQTNVIRPTRKLRQWLEGRKRFKNYNRQKGASDLKGHQEEIEKKGFRMESGTFRAQQSTTAAGARPDAGPLDAYLDRVCSEIRAARPG